MTVLRRIPNLNRAKIVNYGNTLVKHCSTKYWDFVGKIFTSDLLVPLANINSNMK